MTNPGGAITGAEGDAVVITREYLDTRIDVIREAIAPRASAAQIEVFLHMCAVYELDPFRGEIFLGDKGRPMTSRDGYRKIARRNPRFQACRSGVVYAEDEFDYEQSYVDGQLVISSFRHKPSVSSRKQILGAWAIGQVSGEPDDIKFARFEQYRRGSPTWQNYPDAMIQKVAEVLVLRSVNEISGLYTEEELSDGDTTSVRTTDVSPPTRLASPEDDVETRPDEEPAEAARPEAPPEPEQAVGDRPSYIDGILIADLMEELEICTDDNVNHAAVVQRRQLQARVRDIYKQMRPVAVQRMSRAASAQMSVNAFEARLRNGKTELSRRAIEILIRLCVDESMWDEGNQAELAELWEDHTSEAAA
jgi:hypothetical protein